VEVDPIDGGGSLETLGDAYGGISLLVLGASIMRIVVCEVVQVIVPAKAPTWNNNRSQRSSLKSPILALRLMGDSLPLRQFPTMNGFT